MTLSAMNLSVRNLSAPSKTFLIGEYIATNGGPCIVLNTSPRFELQVRAGHGASGITPTSPAGKLLAQHQNSQWHIAWHDPHQGQGGFGASTAQWALCHQLLLPAEKKWQNLIQKYQQFAWDQVGLPPSGADVVAQVYGDEMTFIDRTGNELKSFAWPFKDHDFILARTGQKTATHEHLKTMSAFSDPEMELAARACREGLEQSNFAKFMTALQSFDQRLQAHDLVVTHTRELKNKISQWPDVLLVKGCGALGADVLLVLCPRSATRKISAHLQELNCPPVATSADLCGGVRGGLYGELRTPASVEFRHTAYGKWILAGEHTVLRGGMALVFPVFSRAMSLSVTNNNEPFQLHTQGENADDLRAFFNAIIAKALELTNRTLADLNGHVAIDNQIPLGAGLGASAAFCVNIARWLVWLGWLKDSEVFEFSRTLESIPHGESSGVDIATVMASRGISFHKSGEWQTLDIKWRPHLYLHHTGEKGLTAHCVKKVKELIARDPQTGLSIDQNMKDSVQQAQHALSSNPEAGLPLLTQAIEQAEKCFEKWDLISGEMARKRQWLKEHGALAVKPVGSGGGGYLLSLWSSAPPAEIRDQLIACNEEAAYGF